MFPNDRQHVPQDICHLLERGAIPEETRRQRVPVPMRMGVLHAGFLEDSGECPFGYPHGRPARGLPVPEKVRAVLGGIPRQRERAQNQLQFFGDRQINGLATLLRAKPDAPGGTVEIPRKRRPSSTCKRRRFGVLFGEGARSSPERGAVHSARRLNCPCLLRCVRRPL